MRRLPKSVGKLAPAPYNPRSISEAALDGLTASIEAFGDISGLVWNRRTGRVVCGHQRLRAMQKRWGENLSIKDGSVVTPEGERFPIRVVDWDEATEQAANVAANSPLSGASTAGARARRMCSSGRRTRPMCGA